MVQLKPEISRFLAKEKKQKKGLQLYPETKIKAWNIEKRGDRKQKSLPKLKFERLPVSFFSCLIFAESLDNLSKEAKSVVTNI